MREKMIHTNTLHKALQALARTKKTLEELKANFNPAQPRDPRGTPTGGQWSRGGMSFTVSGNITERLASPATVSRTAPAVTVHSQNSITIHHPDGTNETRTGGHRSLRNNNPGNLEYGSFAIRHGAIGSNGRFAVFPDMNTGYRASEALILSPQYRGLTVNQVIARRSPPQENNTNRLQREITTAAKVGGSQVINTLNQYELQRLTDALHRFEGTEQPIVTHTPIK